MKRGLTLFLLYSLVQFASYASNELSSCTVNLSLNSANPKAICQATIIDQSNILMERSCRYLGNGRQSRQKRLSLNCGDGIFNISIKRDFSRNSNHEIINIGNRLPYFPTKHYSDEDTRNCYVKGHDKDYPIRSDKLTIDIARIRTSKPKSKNALSAAPVFCHDGNSDRRVLMGVVSNKQEFIPISDLKEKYQLNSNFNVDFDDSNYADETIQTVCEDALNCVSNLIKPVKELNDKLEEILKVYQDQKLKEEREKLAQDFKDIEKECRRGRIIERISYDQVEEAGFGDSATGVLEKSAISVARFIESINPLDEEDFLLGQFRKTKSIADNLSDDKIVEIFNEVNKKDLGNLEKIKELTIAYAETIVNKILDEMGTFGDKDQEKIAFINGYKKDFKACIQRSVNSSQVKECAAIFTNNIAIGIGEEELKRQVAKNFSQEDGISLLTNHSTHTYMKCIDNNLGKFKKVLDTTGIVKGCVYKGILLSYQETRKKRINDVIKGYTGKDDNSKLVTSILDRSNDCRFSPVINKSKHTDGEYLALAKMDTELFAQTISECVASLTKNATFDVVELAITTNPTISSALTLIKRDKLVNEIKEVHLPACLKAKNTNDGNKCAKFVTAIATLTAASSILEIEFDKQFIALDLSEQESEKFKKEILTDYDHCAKQAKDKFYRNLKEEPNEKEVNNCLKQAIISLSSKILPKSIEKAALEKGLEKEIVDKTMTQKRLSTFKGVMKECLNESLSKYESMQSFQDNLNKEIQNCTFITQKDVVNVIALETAYDQTKDYKLSDSQKSSLSNLINSHIQNSTKENIDFKIDTLTPILVKDIAPIAIETTLYDFKNKLTKEEFDHYSNTINQQIQSCINDILARKDADSEVKASDETKVCMSVAVKDAYKNLAPKIVLETIIGLFPGEKEKAEALSHSALHLVSKCLDSIENDVHAQDNAQTCLKDQISPIAKTIASSLIKDLNKFANKDGIQTPFLETRSYYTFEQCMDQKFETLNETNENMTKCIEALEVNIKSELKNRFVKVYGKNSPNELSDVMDLLLTIPSTKKSDNFKDPNAKGMPNAELLSTLELVGETMSYSCTNNASVCSKDINSAAIAFKEFKKNNPDAQTSENIKFFMSSDIARNLVASQLGMNLNQTFKQELKDYNGKDNLVFKQVDKITNNAMLSKLLKTPAGKKLQAYIFKKVDEGDMENVAEDLQLRALLSEMLTSDTGDDSFGDQLAYALVQTELTKMRNRSRGFKGFFREFTINMGDLFDIIDKKDFKWEKITQTKNGKKAREFMIKQIMAPAIAGINLESIPSTKKKYKNRSEQNMAYFKDLLTKALKEANH